MKITALVLSVIAVLAAAPSARAGLRCGTSLIQAGDSAAHLLLECGDPLLVQTIATENTSTTEGIVEQWTYDLGPGRFLRIVTIEGGKVSTIENGERH